MAQTTDTTKRHGAFNISQWSIEHPYVIIAFYVGVVLLSILVIGYQMPRRMMPYVQSPMIGIVTMMPGLTAGQMETYISKPIEEQMVNIRGVRYIRSTSQNGFSIVSLEFHYGYDMRKALFDVQALMNVVQGYLPVTTANLKPSWVLPIDPLNLPVLSLCMTGKGWNPVMLEQFAANQVVNQLKRVRNVQSVVVYGGKVRQLRVVVNRNRLAAYGLSVLDLKEAIDSFNTNSPGGNLTFGTSETTTRLDTLALSSAQVADYPIKSVNGRIVYVKDVARVIDTNQEERYAYNYVHREKVGGKMVPVTTNGVEISIIEDPSASSPPVIHNVMQRIHQIEKDHPGLHFSVAYNNAHFVGILVHNMVRELVAAIIMTGIAVLFFLGNWRGTLISVITIPISLSMAVLVLVPLGMTLNSSTLIGLLLSIGRLVDDSIINIHSIERHLRMGKAVKEATVDGVTEVMLAVAASTFMLCLALSPLLFVGGIVQLMFVGLVWPIILGLLASFLVSWTLTPVLASYLLTPESAREAERRHPFNRYLLQPVERVLEKTEAWYSKAIGWALENRFTVITAMLATIIIGSGFYRFIGSEMMPLADIGQAYALFETEPGTSFAQTKRMTTQFEHILMKYPEIQKVSTEMGFEPGGTYFNGYAMPTVNSATMMITLTDKSERKKTIWQVIDSARRQALATIPGVRQITIKEMGSDVMASSQAPITLMVYGKSLPVIARLTHEVAQIARKTPGMHQVATDWGMQTPDYQIKINPRRAAEIGLSTQQVADQVYYSIGGGLTNEFYRLPNIRQDTIQIRYQQDQRASVADIGQLLIVGKHGIEVPLRSIATVQFRYAPNFIEHDQMRRVDNVLGFYRNGGPASMDLTMSVLMKAISKINFPPGYGITMRGDMTQMMTSMKRLMIGLGLAVLFIFLVLVAQFRGFLQPLQMVLSLPLELSGVFIALFLMHQSFSTVSVMAIIVLTGMDATTAILLIDLIIRYRESGVPRDEAVKTASPQRLRPILMTSIITILVMIPVAFFPETGMDAYSSLGTVVIGGLTVGTLLSLIGIPVMHTYIDDLSTGMARIFRRSAPENSGPVEPTGE
ncbi:MAG: efflux RND transporter permease subunit [Armatimonadetes bacterium]|nr:efflux RND transporter permease subunit [Armatimonadota bacterium]